MSEQVGETYVTITPVVNETEFKAQAENQVNRAVQSVKAEVQVVAAAGGNGDDPVERIRQQLKELPTGFAQAANTLDETLFGGLEERATRLKDDVKALGGDAVEKLSTDFAAVAQAQQTARQEMDRFTTTTARAKAEALALAEAEKAEAAAQRTAAREKARATIATEKNTLAERENQLVRRGSLREQLGNVIRGQESPGSLFSGASFLRLGIGTLAFSAAIQGLNDLREGLKVTGDEAFTFEGKFRNAGAELLGGDLIGGVRALIAEAPTATETLNAMSKAVGTTSVDLRNFAQETAKSAEEEEKLSNRSRGVEQITKILDGRFLDLGRSSRSMAAGMAEASDDAFALANAADAAAAAVLDVNSAIEAAGGNDAAVFGERGRIGQNEGRRTQLDPGGTADTTAVQSTQRAILRERRQRTATLQDDLALAQKNLREDEADFRARARRGDIEGQEARKLDIERGRNEVKRIQDQIDALEAAAERDREAAAKKRRDEAKKRRDEAAQRLRDEIAFREDTLQGALADAQDGTLADQRRALRALIAFHQAESRNQDLDKAERQKQLLKSQAYQRELNALNKQALATALGVKAQNLENAILAARLTEDDDADDKRAQNAKLKFLKAQVERAKGDALAVATARGDLLAYRLELQGETSTTGGGFTLEDLFAEAQKEFQAFGSNVSSSITTGGGVRGQLAGSILGQQPRMGPGQAAQLTEAQKTNQILSGILSAVTRRGVYATPQPFDKPPDQGEAATGPGAATAWRTKKLTGMLG